MGDRYPKIHTSMLNIENEVANLINHKLKTMGFSKKWLSRQTTLGYEHVKRSLNPHDPTKLSLREADIMLVALGSDLRSALAEPVINALKAELIGSINKFKGK